MSSEGWKLIGPSGSHRTAWLTSRPIPGTSTTASSAIDTPKSHSVSRCQLRTGIVSTSDAMSSPTVMNRPWRTTK